MCGVKGHQTRPRRRLGGSEVKFLPFSDSRKHKLPLLKQKAQRARPSGLGAPTRRFLKTERQTGNDESGMSSSRPVPRRESPWALPEGETREPKAHRCNDRAEDVIQACFEGNPFKTVPGPFKLFWRCMRSKPGKTQPHLIRIPDNFNPPSMQIERGSPEEA
ncbi:hypothetical protein EJ110_NYTH49920 [Nymphaea thermarum]|nr:hypothetical protein EJ110_NYTH49920 [Nymphaea thermarum]